jgi:Protein of unknown function (DUF4230)
MRRWLLPLLIGLALGAAGVLFTGDRLVKWISPGPDGATLAQASLQAVRREARLTVLAARFTAVITSEQTRLGLLSGTKTLIVPGTVRYELDWSRIAIDDLGWSPATQTLRVMAPAPMVAGPEVDIAATRELRAGSLLFALTDAEEQLDAANRGLVNEVLLTQARAPALTDLARTAAIEAVTRTFLLPLRAAGFAEARVVVTLKA